ncbi:MAG: hypothetical protein QNJ19_05345 [Woeseiaceae bacterium]|nr:hypothetical protein [Woeseiaceae bacterium]
MRHVLALVVGATLALASSSTSVAVDGNPGKVRIALQPPAQFWKTRPVRRDTPLRDENISDLEIVEIEAEMRSLYPGSIVYISAVTTGCPCEDGPECTDLVWSVATSGNNSRGVALSNIDGKWQVGPLQQWWLDYDELWAAYRASRHPRDTAEKISYDEHMRRVDMHKQRFPVCVDTSIKALFDVDNGADD